MNAIAIGSDDAGYELKELLAEHLRALGHRVADYGIRPEDSDDYPDVALRVAEAVASGQHDRAILICATGIGMAITANKVHGVRAAQAGDPYSAERARKSNNAQVLTLGARVVGPELAKTIIDHWLAAEFAGGRSAVKVAKVDQVDAAHRAFTLAQPPEEPWHGHS